MSRHRTLQVSSSSSLDKHRRRTSAAPVVAAKCTCKCSGRGLSRAASLLASPRENGTKPERTLRADGDDRGELEGARKDRESSGPPCRGYLRQDSSFDSQAHHLPGALLHSPPHGPDPASSLDPCPRKFPFRFLYPQFVFGRSSS